MTAVPDGEVCVVCRRRTPATGIVCDPDRDLIHQQLTDLPRQVAALTYHLTPTAQGPGDRVTVARTEAPLPARLDVLSLIGGGSAAVSGPPRRDDQTAALPPAEWADGWVRAWRARLGDTVTARTRHVAPHTPDPVGDRHRAAVGRRVLAGMALRGDPDAARAYVVTRVLADAHQAAVNAAVFGLYPGRAGRRAGRDRDRDAVADEWQLRFGVPAPPASLVADVNYLVRRLDAICELGDDGGVRAFAVELRAMTATLGVVLGERTELVWLGRCPVTADEDDEDTQPCGAPLWQDPYVAVYGGGGRVIGQTVQCPRCTTVWGPQRTDLIRLADAIRRVWPIDRHRRYPLHQATTLPRPRCPRCLTRVLITWRDATGTGDTEQWVRADAARCPHHCPEATNVI